MSQYQTLVYPDDGVVKQCSTVMAYYPGVVLVLTVLLVLIGIGLVVNEIYMYCEER
uniref:Uncharacterized protein n=1 Tax=Octopus bimaculoides TaxID=37653 RepID=A0A0L8HRY9_OCTBM